MHYQTFDSLLELDDAQIRLDCAALQFARGLYPHISISKYVTLLDQLAREVADARPGLSVVYRYQALREVLVQDFELRGNSDDYYDPENHFLNRVLDRGLGVPISLSIVWMEVARRLKWPVAGIGFPGHFLVRLEDEERYVLVDPFRDGRALSVEDCEQILAHHFDDKIKFRKGLLSPISLRPMLARMLSNLRQIYAVNQDWPRLEFVLRRLVAVDPLNGRYRQELAAVACRRGRMLAAYQHLATYLQQQPDAEDVTMVERDLRHIESAIASSN